MGSVDMTRVPSVLKAQRIVDTSVGRGLNSRAFWRPGAVEAVPGVVEARLGKWEMSLGGGRQDRAVEDSPGRWEMSPGLWNSAWASGSDSLGRGSQQ